MDTQQSINLEIFNEFEKRGIEFAYPTQTLFLNKEEAAKN
jgi:small-conductance mechanosensitive channel